MTVPALSVASADTADTIARSKTCCERCGVKNRKGVRRRRCKTCTRLVGPCCWYDRKSVCEQCYGKPRTPEEHLARIEERHAVMVQAFEDYEHACLDLWDDGDRAKATAAMDPTPYDAFRDWSAAIGEAAEDLGISVGEPIEPFQEFPTAPEEGDDYDISALRALAAGPRFKLTKGGKSKTR
jgi:hypothetical protein